MKGYHDTSRHLEAELVPGLVLFRWDAPLFFANAEMFRDAVEDAIQRSPTPVRWVVIAAEPVTDIDATAADVLSELHDALEAADIELAFAELKGPAKDRLRRYGLFDRMRAAEEGQRTGSVIEILVLQALAHHLNGDIPAALVPLERAMTLSEPEGYVRTFVDEGPPMAVILEAAAKRGVAPTYVRELLTAFGPSEDRRPIKQALIEPLSERELDVLRLLATDLDGPAIASQLVVSLSTIRSHTKSIYAKLGVNNRRAAVRRGEELDLMSRVDRQQRPIIVHDS